MLTVPDYEKAYRDLRGAVYDLTHYGIGSRWTHHEFRASLEHVLNATPVAAPPTAQAVPDTEAGGVRESGHRDVGESAGPPSSLGHECGHRFQFIVRSSLHISGPGEHVDADWWGTADGPVEVRAHNLRDALLAASALPLHVWFDHGRDEAEDDEITNAVWEEAVANGEPWATGERDD